MKNTLQRFVAAFCCALAFASCQKRSDVTGSSTNASAGEETAAKPADDPNPQVAETSSGDETPEDPADQYFKAWLLVRESEKSADRDESARLLQEALGHFAAIKSKSPGWKTAMVESRIQVTKDSLVALAERGR
ncbi:MAG TPA: hypothetical protein VGE67_13375 [Haloferula sp.]